MRALTPACMLVLVAACQATGGVIESLDSRSGLTLVTADAPVTFARTQGQYSRSARDYVYVAPVEVNERGVRDYYLWVGVASTLDRGYVAADEVRPDLLIIAVDGAPMEFALEPWDDRLPRLAGRTVYDPAVTPSGVLVARVTLDQLARVAAARTDEIRISSAGNQGISYYLWDDQAWWPEFLNQAPGR